MSDAEESPPESENPSFKDERSTAPYNEAKAREEFGDEFVAKLKREQGVFNGDWWQLALLARNLEEDDTKSEIKAEDRLKDWNEFVQRTRGDDPRERIHLENAELREAHLENANLFRAHLQNAHLRNAHLENADLEDAHLENAKLEDAHLENANLYDAHLENAKLSFAHLEYANLGCADLENAELQYAHLENADLSLAHLENAKFHGAHLENADLHRAHLENADLQNAHLEYAGLYAAVLEGTDVRDATGIHFDSNRFNLARIEGNAPDPWSVLRREYSGPFFFVHLILLVVFFAPWGARALYLSALAKGQDWTAVQMDTLGETVFHRVLVPARDSPVGGRKTYEIARRFNEQEQQFYDSHERRSAIWALLTGGNGLWGFGMAMIVIFYNGARALLTFKVSTLRDAEERSSITPSLVEYYGLCHPLSEDGTGNRAAMTLWLKSNLAQRWLRPPRWLSRLKWLAPVARGYWAWLDSVERSGLKEDRPPRALIDCIGLYRLHQIARVILWLSLASVAYNTVDWLTSTYLWMPK